MRSPVHDKRERMLACGLAAQGLGKDENGISRGGLTSLERDKVLNEDPKWNETEYVLANYKTELCKRPPRLCRQGFACPSYHNARDKRRCPHTHKYRSTPCPNVKHGDDWGDPAQCENGEQCQYCHTRTEQQFHPEIYKSTKCNDMLQTGYCPRGPFCAFAHVEQEMTIQREIAAASENSLAAYVTSAFPEKANSIEEKVNDLGLCNSNKSLPQPIGKERSRSFSNGSTTGGANMRSPFPVGSAPAMTFADAARNRKTYEEKQSNKGTTRSNLFGGDTLQSIIGNALDEDVDVDDLSLSTAFETSNDRDQDIESLSSSFGNNLQPAFNSRSEPVSIPGANQPQSPFSPLVSPLLNGNGFGSYFSTSGNSEVNKLKEEVGSYKTKLKHWEEGYAQARAACEAWKKEVEDLSRKKRELEDELTTSKKEKEELRAQLKAVKTNIIIPLCQREEVPSDIRDLIQAFIVDQSFQQSFYSSPT
ncbi:DgyrCDS2079 [Dimorphilus gyrociliatus]|nr:DgyrCDS2079 [Dimorphilus gyrociliatus]